MIKGPPIQPLMTIQFVRPWPIKGHLFVRPFRRPRGSSDVLTSPPYVLTSPPAVAPTLAAAEQALAGGEHHISNRLPSRHSPVVSIIRAVTRYGSQFAAGRRSSRYPFWFRKVSRGIRMLAPRSATPYRYWSIEQVSCSPVRRFSLPRGGNGGG